MRSVPHRVVCLLGLDDGAFPRKAPRDGDDLMLDDPHLGERDPRSEDRQLLLDALLAATERLIVTYTGNDERTNAAAPPAVPVGELLDAIDATVRCRAAAARAASRWSIRHPLQPFDPRNFTAGDDRRRGAVELRSRSRSTAPGRWPGRASDRRPFLDGPLARRARRGGRARLTSCASSSTRCGPSCASGSGSACTRRADEIEDELSVELDGLERWGVGQRLLEARLRGIDERTAIRPRSRAGRCRPASWASR